MSYDRHKPSQVLHQSQPECLERPTEYSQEPGIQPQRSAAETLKKWLGSCGEAKGSEVPECCSASWTWILKLSSPGGLEEI